ncbi:MAG: Unknown protein, partial [uncultured Sulfurovum sp.]
MSLFGNKNNTQDEFNTDINDEELIDEDVHDRITYWIL